MGKESAPEARSATAPKDDFKEPLKNSETNDQPSEERPQSPDSVEGSTPVDPNQTEEQRKEERRRKRRSKWTEEPKKESGFSIKTPSEVQADLLAAQQQMHLQQSQQSAQQRNRIYVGSLDFSLCEQDMRDIFQSFGEIANIDMPKEGNRSKGYCFVEFKNPESAEMTLQTMQNFVLKGRVIKVGRPTSNIVQGAAMTAGLPLGMGLQGGLLTGAGGMPVTGVLNSQLSGVNGMPSMPVAVQGGQDMNRIYIGNVPYSFTAEDMRKIFAVFGTILSCQLIPSAENPGTHRGYGFLEFSTNAEAKSAIETMNGFEVQGKQLKVNYSTQLHSRPATPATPTLGTSPSMMMSSGQYGSGGITGSNLAPIGNVSASTGYERGSSAQAMSASPGIMSTPGSSGVAVNIQAPITSSQVILMTNMINPSEIDREFPTEVKQESAKYGEVADVRIQIVNNDVRVFVKFESASAACSAVPSLNGRWFSGRLIKCKLYNQEAYESGNYELNV